MQPLPARTARAERPATLHACLLALLVLVGLALRFGDLAAGPTNPDEGNYLVSARLHELERGGGAARWWSEDRAWVGELAADYARVEGRTTYPHSYLHQAVARCLFRLGTSRLLALRSASAALGTLTVLAAYLLARRMRGPGLGLAVAALTAVSPVLVWYARTGWGQTGCTLFYTVGMLAAYALLDPTRTPSRTRTVALGCAYAGAALLAYGYHEMIVVHVLWTAATAPLLVALHGDGPARARLAGALKSPRIHALWAGALPIALLTLLLWAANPWARDVWFDVGREARHGERIAGSLRFLFGLTRVQDQIGWSVLALALVGAVALLRGSRWRFAFLATALGGSVVPFFLLYSNPSLVRIYLPTVVLVSVLAGEGLLALRARLPGRAGDLVTGAVVVHLALVGWVSVFGPLPHALGVRTFYDIATRPAVDVRRSHAPVLEALVRARAADGALEPVGVLTVNEPLFWLLDAGVPARHVDADPATWPSFVVGLQPDVARALAAVGADGAYRSVAVERAGRFHLFESVR